VMARLHLYFAVHVVGVYGGGWIHGGGLIWSRGPSHNTNVGLHGRTATLELSHVHAASICVYLPTYIHQQVPARVRVYLR
jgi:hypothetical protein